MKARKIDIVIAPAGQPPFEVELIVLEEDRWRVMSANSQVLPERRDSAMLISEMDSDALPLQGDVVFRGNRALAIVHDLERSPSCDADTVRSCLEKVFAHCREAGIADIAIQPLGAVHGDLRRRDVIELIESLAAGIAQRVWVIADP